MALRLVIYYLALFLFFSVNTLDLDRGAYTHILCSGIAGGRKGEQMGSDQLLQMYANSIPHTHACRHVDRGLKRRSQACALAPVIRSCIWIFRITRTSHVCLARSSGV